MIRFEESVVRVEQVDDTNWKLLDGFEYQGKKQLFQVPDGQPTALLIVLPPAIVVALALLAFFLVSASCGCRSRSPSWPGAGGAGTPRRPSAPR